MLIIIRHVRKMKTLILEYLFLYISFKLITIKNNMKFHKYLKILSFLLQLNQQIMIIKAALKICKDSRQN